MIIHVTFTQVFWNNTDKFVSSRDPDLTAVEQPIIGIWDKTAGTEIAIAEGLALIETTANSDDNN